jgi:hypothetical protein
MSGGYIDPDYIEVSERVRLFFDKYPDGRLQTDRPWVEAVADKVFVCCVAHAYRTPDDPSPSTGVAWEPVPGPTSFTKDSELMNAQTSAWGRAIIAAGIPSKKIASADEVQARRSDGKPTSTDKAVTKAQHGKIAQLIKQLTEEAPEQDWVANARGFCREHFGKNSRADLTTVEAGKLIDWLEGVLEAQKVPFG